MATRSKTRMPDDSTLIVEHHGKLWKPTTDATVSLEECLSAKARFTQILADQAWNQWNEDSHAAELSRLEGILDQWTRAEPGFRPLTNEEFEQRCKQRRTQRESEHAEQARQREARERLYDPAREAARLDLLENESLVRHEQTELAELRNGPASRAWTADGLPRRSRLWSGRSTAAESASSACAIKSGTSSRSSTPTAPCPESGMRQRSSYSAPGDPTK